MIYIFIASGFEEAEALVTADILRRAELDVQLVGIGGKEIRGSHGITVVCDIADHQASCANLQMIVLPGGMPGTLNLEKSQVVQSFIDFAVQNNLYIAAICAAPSILGHKGLLEGKKATCYLGFETQLTGAQFTGTQLEQDGNIITADGAGAAFAFGLHLVQVLLGAPRANVLGDAMKWRG